MSIFDRLNSGISYLENAGCYSIANTLYLAKELIKDQAVFSVNQIESEDYYGIYGKINVSANSSLNFMNVDYTKS